MALNSFAIFYSQEAHLYSLSLALTVASAAMALRLMGGSGSKSIWVAYVLCGAATIYTHVLAVLALLAQNLYALFLLVGDRRGMGSASTLRPAGSLLLRWTVAQIAIGVLCAPWLISAWSENFEFTVNGSVSSPATMLWRKFTNFTYTAYIPGEISSLATMLWRRFASYTFGAHVPDAIWLLDSGLFAVAIIAAAVLGALFVVRLGTERKEESAKDETEIEQQEVSEAQKSTALVQRSQSNHPPPALPACFRRSHSGLPFTRNGGYTGAFMPWLCPLPATAGHRAGEHRRLGRELAGAGDGESGLTMPVQMAPPS